MFITNYTMTYFYGMIYEDFMEFLMEYWIVTSMNLLMACRVALFMKV